MSTDLQQSLYELEGLFKQGKSASADVSKKLAKLKLELAQSGLYFAPPSGKPDDLAATRGILEIGAFHSLRQENLKAYWQYNSQLQPFYNNLESIIPASPNRPVTLGLHLLALLATGKLTEFHTLLETLDKKVLDDVFVRLPVDMERWLMEGSYAKMYRAKERVPREEFNYLLEQLWVIMRSQIAQTISSSYFSIPIQSAARLVYFNEDTKSIMQFAETAGWAVIPSKNLFVFPQSKNPEIAAFGKDQAGTSASASANANASADPDIAAAVAALGSKGVVRGVPMSTMVGPSLKLAHQLETIV